jgi:hypothetical protein
MRIPSALNHPTYPLAVLRKLRSQGCAQRFPNGARNNHGLHDGRLLPAGSTRTVIGYQAIFRRRRRCMPLKDCGALPRFRPIVGRSRFEVPARSTFRKFSTP